MTTDQTPRSPFRGGFSFRDNVVGKPFDPTGMMLGTDWVWAPGATPEQLLNAVAVKGWAVTPGRWKDGHKSKKSGTLIECGYILLDWDQGMTWEEMKEVQFFKDYACFAYTSVSHRQPGKGDRFRVVFALDTQVYRPEVIDRLIEVLHLKVPGSDRAINSASLLYGNPGAETHVFNFHNRLNAQDLYFEWAVMDAKRKFHRAAQLSGNSGNYTADNSVRRVKRWLSHIPNQSRATWVQVAGCLRNIEEHGHEWAYPLFLEWSAEGYDDFDPEACESLWESLDGRPGGFIRLKEIATEHGLPAYHSLSNNDNTTLIYH